MGWKRVKEHYRIGHDVLVSKERGICIGTGYVHDLIVITPTLELHTNLGPHSGELARYYREMADDREKLAELIALPDEFERSVPVYTYEGGQIIECQCEELGYPNVTHDGQMMYDNTFSTDREKVRGWAIRTAEIRIRNSAEHCERLSGQMLETSQRLQQACDDLQRLKDDC